MTKKLDEVLSNGGVVKYKGVSIYVDNPNNLEDYSVPSGYYIINALGWNVYFKTRDRIKAQEICNLVYGKGKYTIRGV